MLCARSRPPQEIGRFDPKGTGEPIHDVDPGGIDASFERADVGAVDLGAMGELFLRQAASLPQLPEIDRQYVSDVHPQDGILL